MLYTKEKVKGKHGAIDPYIKQTPPDVDQPNYRQYEDRQFDVFEYTQYELEKIRERRQSPPHIPKPHFPPTPTPPKPTTKPPPPPPTPPPPRDAPSPPGPPPGGSSGSGSPKPGPVTLEYESVSTPLYGITATFTLLMIFLPLMVRKGPNQGIVRACVLLTTFCMWIFWFTIYFGQMNPLMGPRLENTTVAWIAYKLGKPFENATS